MANRQAIEGITQGTIDSIFAETGMTTVLSIAVDNRVFYLHSAAEGLAQQYLTQDFLPRSLLRTSGGWILLSGYSRGDLWAFLRSRPEEEQQYVNAFLTELERIAETGVCAAPGVAPRNVDGVSVAVKHKNRVVAALGIIGEHDEIDSRKAELVEILNRYLPR
ncbi:hypothetical protein [Corynebacterium sp. H113]|uniref:hypothetical protein n=1 Tax=Corynebacterium sp. H113 TaxID=3133419 RepID=UPI00309C8B20